MSFNLYKALFVPLIGRNNTPMIILTHWVKGRDVKCFFMGLNIVQINQVIVLLVPRCVADLGQHVSKLTVAFNVVQIKRAEIEPQIAQMN